MRNFVNGIYAPQSPSKVWSDRLGVQLHNDWGLENHADLQERLVELRTNNPVEEAVFVEVLYRKLVTKFPELATLKHEWSDNLKYHVVFGCISQFNFNDIKYFLEIPWSQRSPALKFRRMDVEVKIAHATNYSEILGWVLSEPTLALIESNIDKWFDAQMHPNKKVVAA